MRLYWVISLWLVSIAASAHGAEHSYQIYGFRWPSQERCQAHAKAIADRIAERHSVTVLGAGCERSEVTNDTSAIIRYESAEPLSLVTTYPLNRYYHQRGFYSSEQVCLDRLNQEIELFKFHTKLEPIQAFCSSGRFRSAQPWFAYIDAFGNAARQPDLLGWSADWVHSHSLQEIFDIMRLRLEPRGIWLTNLSWHPGAGLGSASAFAYFDKANAEYSLSTTVVATIPGLQACRATADQLDAGLAAAGGNFQQLAAYCTSPYSNPTSFSLIALHEAHWVDIVPSMDEFSTLQECEAARAGITEEMRGIRPKIAATVCGLRPHSLPSPRNPYRVFAVAPK
jgi:hypothetical protein